MEQAIVRERVELKVADGTKMAAYVARPQEEGPHSGVIVLQEAFGVNSHIRDVTERFAREGYVAIAPELFHRTAPGFEGRYDNFASVVPHMKAVTHGGRRTGLAGQLCMANGAARREYGRHVLCGLLPGGKDFFSGEHRVAPARDRVVLRRWNRAGIIVPGAGCQSAHAVGVGRIG